MASLAGTTLVWPGSALDRIWNLNPRAHDELVPFGRVVGIPFLLLGATLAVASLGWFKRRRWGWRLAVAIIATQVLGDLVNIFRGDPLRGGIGFLIAGPCCFISYNLSCGLLSRTVNHRMSVRIPLQMKI